MLVYPIRIITAEGLKVSKSEDLKKADCLIGENIVC